MAGCLIVDNGEVSITQDGMETCTGFILVTVTEYQQAMNPLSTFDRDVAYQVTGYLFLSFFVGHSIGRLVKWLGRK